MPPNIGDARFAWAGTGFESYLGIALQALWFMCWRSFASSAGFD